MKDTIAAIATGLTESGIGIIRISGSDSYDIINKIFKTKTGKNINLDESHKVHYGFIVDAINDNVSRETLDEVLVINMKGPKSFTGEDVVEIDCHGGVLMMKRILELVIKCGARLSEPGEFTKRAFLNGRIDLSQAEAVIDIINAKNDNALKASVKQLKGVISEKIKKCRGIILEDTAFIEAALDDPEHISLDGFNDKLYDDINTLSRDIEYMIRTSENGKLIKEGINTVIVGKPNAGKSSLLNALMGEERAIVTDIAGTTRDTLEESINLGGISLNIIDTAGIRDTDDVVEKIGVERALNAAENADLIIYVVDGTEELDDSDYKIISFIKSHNKKVLVVLNKLDLKQKVNTQPLSELDNASIIKASAKEMIGIDDIQNEIEKLFYNGNVSFNDEFYITSARQKNALNDALESLRNVEISISNSMPEDFYSIDLMNAYTSLGYVLGEEVDEDLVNEIFGKFCMGK